MKVKDTIHDIDIVSTGISYKCSVKQVKASAQRCTDLMFEILKK